MRQLKSENDVKRLVKEWYDKLTNWHYAPIQTGMGAHGIHDRLGPVPVVVTQAMVGKIIGVFVSVESKRPGRRNEPDRGMSKHQKLVMDEINSAGGIAIVCDGVEDLQLLNQKLEELRNGPR